MSDVDLSPFFPVIPDSEVIVPQGNCKLPYTAVLPSGTPATIQYSNYPKMRRRRLYKSVVKAKEADNAVASSAVPTLTSISVRSGYPDIASALVGTNFDEAATLKVVSASGVETSAASVVRASATSITFAFPVVADGVYKMKIGNPGGYAIPTGETKTITVVNAPSFTSTTPDEGYATHSLTLVGGNFHPSLSIKLVNSEGVETVCGSIVRTGITGATCTIPNVADGVYSIKLINPTGSLVVEEAITVINSPSFTSVTPETGYAGTSLTFVGENFHPSLSIKVLDSNGNEDVCGSIVRTSITGATCTIPNVPNGTYSIHLLNPLGDVIEEDAFVVANDPSFTSVTPDNGDSGAALTIVGDNFHPSLGIRLIDSNNNEYPCGTVVRTSLTGATCTIPTVADGVYSLKLINPLGSVTAPDAVTVTNV